MNTLLKKEQNFLKLLIMSTDLQRKALIKTITPSQMRAVVQIIFNVLHGNRAISEKNIKKLKPYKVIIRRFISKGITIKRRSRILQVYWKEFILLLKVVEKEL